MEFKHPKYYAKLRKIYKQAEKLKQPAIEETVPLSEIEEATSEQSTSKQTLKHRGPRSTSNGRASKTFP